MELKTQRNLAVVIAAVLAALCFALALKADVITLWYVGSTGSDKYHKPSCQYAQQIHDEHLTQYASAAAAARDGRTPCSLCLP